MRFAIPIFVKPLKNQPRGAIEAPVVSAQSLSTFIRNTGTVNLSLKTIIFTGKDQEGKVDVKLFWPTDPEGAKWKEASVDDNTVACEDLCLADLNGDGRLDVATAGRATHNVKVFFNAGPE